jgi:uncharacterized protein (DUF433 family)
VLGAGPLPQVAVGGRRELEGRGERRRVSRHSLRRRGLPGPSARDHRRPALCGGFWRLTPRANLITEMDLLARITYDPKVMGGRPCIRGLRVTVGTVVGLLAAGRTVEEILSAYPYLERDDIQAALSYAA